MSMGLGSLGNKINVATLVRDESNWKTYTECPELRMVFHHEQRRRL